MSQNNPRSSVRDRSRAHGSAAKPHREPLVAPAMHGGATDGSRCGLIKTLVPIWVWNNLKKMAF